MKRRSWPLIAIAFTALLAVVSITAYDVSRKTRQLHDDILRTEALAQGRKNVLRKVREDFQTLAIAIRDALLDPAESPVATRLELDNLHRSILTGLDRLDDPQESRMSGLVRQLRNLDEEYWETAMVPLGWPAQRRRAEAGLYLRRTLSPLRKSAMESARSVELIEESLSRENQARVEDSFARLGDALQMTWTITLSIGLIITVLTVWRFSRIEEQASALQHQTLLDREQLRVLSQTLVHAYEAERKALSRELHDQIGQMLTAIQMAFSNIEQGRGDSQRHIDDGKTLTERTVAAVRNISMGLRPSILDDLGLDPAIQWQAREFSKRSGVPVKVQIEGHFESLSESLKICLYRVVQEALTNCARHAQAKNVRINLHASRDSISLTVADDGSGFDLATLPKGGLGLFGMRERVRELSGTVSIFAQPGKGTLVRVEVPLNGEVRA